MKRIIIALILFVLPLAASAQWSTDPLVNLSIADRPSEQVVPKIAATGDGGCFVGWYDLASGNYDIYLQRLDMEGQELWAHNGIAVSAHPQNSWIVDWDLIADGAGGAVLTFVDIRAGGDWDVYAYRVAADGGMLWGSDGIAVSVNADFEADPKVTRTTGGDFVVVWSRSPNVGDGSVMMQRIAPDGTVLLAAGGVPIATETGRDPGFPDLVSDGADGAIVCWLRDIATYSSPRHLRAERFDASGASVWGAPVSVYSAASLPMGYSPEILPDDAGGALLLWHAYVGGIYNSFVQRLDAAGAQLWTPGGVSVSTLGGMYHISPTFSFDSATGDTYVFWDERNTAQSAWGIFGQRFDATGSRLWGASGQSFLPTNSLYKGFLSALPAPGGAMLFWIDEPSGYGSDRVRGFRTDDSGAWTWGPAPIDVATTPSIKGRLPVASASDGRALLIWEDDRAGTVDVYGQAVNTDGSLGDLTGLPGAPVALASLAAYPNPFNPTTTLRVDLKTAQNVELSIHDANGRLIANLLHEDMPAGSRNLRWDGRNMNGATLPSGLYLARLRAEEGLLTEKLLLLK